MLVSPIPEEDREPVSREEQPLEPQELEELSSPSLDTTPVPDGVLDYYGARLTQGDPGTFTPALSRFATDVLTTYDREMIQRIALSLELQLPLLLEGGSGLGKTRAIERMCAELGWECFYVNCHDFDAEVLIGAKTVREDTRSGFGWVDGTATRAVRGNGTMDYQPRVLVLDEYNFMKGETRGRLHEVLDAILSERGYIMLTENDGERVSIPPGLHIVCLQNPPGGKYDDREVLDEPQLTRFNYQKLPDDMPESMMISRALGSVEMLPTSDVDPISVPAAQVPLLRSDIQDIPGTKEVLTRYVEFVVTVSKLVDEYQLAEDQPQPLYFAFQRDFDRVMSYVTSHFNGDLTETFQRALDYFYTNRFQDIEDRQKVRELIAHVGYFPQSSSQRKSLETGDRESDTPLHLFGIDADAKDATQASFLCSYRTRGASDDDVAEGLAFDDSPEAWSLREDLLDNWADASAMCKGISGCQSPPSYDLRRSLQRKGVAADSVLESLAGDDSEAAWELRNELKSKGACPTALLRSIRGIDTERAWELREHYMLPWGTRWRYLMTDLSVKDARAAVLDSLSGIDTDRAWDIRSELEKSNFQYYSRFLLHSLTGLDSERAWDLRERVITKVNPRQGSWGYIARSIIGVDSEKAWKMRERIVHRSQQEDYLIKSIGGIYTPRAWSVRADYLKRHPDNLNMVLRDLSGYQYFAGDRVTAESPGPTS